MKIQEPPVALEVPPGESAYFATLIAGLEEVVADELRERVTEATVLAATRGRLFFSTPGSVREAMGLLTIEHLLACVDQFGDIPPDPRGLEVIEERMTSLDLDEAVSVHRHLHGTPKSPSFRITAQRSGCHAYNSMEIAAAAGAGVVRRYGWDVDLEGYDYDVRVYVTDRSLLVGLRLSPEPLHRRARVEHAAASLNPTVAHAMCRISEPEEGQTVVDPMCGAGTILIERSRLAPPGLLLGGDLFAKPLESAGVNLDANAVRGALVQWDARNLPLPRRSVDRVISNLPWGRRIGSHRVNRHLYPGMIRELSRVLRPEGTAVLLTQEKGLLTRLVSRQRGLEIVRQLPLSLSGMHPVIYVVQRSDDG